MSISEVLKQPAEAWTNLYVNSLNANILDIKDLVVDDLNADTAVFGNTGNVHLRNIVEFKGDIAFQQPFNQLNWNTYFNTSAATTNAISPGGGVLLNTDGSASFNIYASSNNAVASGDVLAMNAVLSLGRTGNLNVASEVTASAQNTYWARNTALQSVASAVTTDATFNGSTVLGTDISYAAGVFTINKNGRYLITYNIDIGTTALGTLVYTRLLINSAGPPSNGLRAVNQTVGNGVNIQYLSSSEVVQMLAGETFSLQMFQFSGGNINCNGAGYLTAYHLP
jgi:hypothetical protein